MEETFTFELVEDSNHEEIKKKTFRGSDTLETIRKTMMTEFNIAANAETRLWISVNNSSFIPFPFLASCWGKELRSIKWRSNVREMIIEVMNEEGTWPRDVGYHRRSSSSYEKTMISQEDIIEIQDKLKGKKNEQLHIEKKLGIVNQRQEYLKKKEKKLKEKQKKLEEEQKKLEEEQKKLEEEQKKLQKEQKEIDVEQKQLESEKNVQSDKRKRTTDEIKSLEDSLNKFVEATRDLVTKLDLGPEIANSNLIGFLTKSIEEKEAALACPVCLETAEAPIFMCLQQHLVCSSCQPRVTSCPECREAYQVNTLFSSDNTDHVT